MPLTYVILWIAFIALLLHFKFHIYYRGSMVKMYFVVLKVSSKNRNGLDCLSTGEIIGVMDNVQNIAYLKAADRSVLTFIAPKFLSFFDGLTQN